MRDALLMRYGEPAEGEISEEAVAGARESFGAYGRALAAAGVLLSADVLQPAAATTTVTRSEGTLRVQDGLVGAGVPVSHWLRDTSVLASPTRNVVASR